MSDVPQPGPTGEIEDADVVEGEVLDAVPVLAAAAGTVAAGEPAELAHARRPVVLPAVQAAAVAAGGFVAGAAVVGLVHRRNRRAHLLRAARAGRRVGRSSGRGSELAQVLGSRSFLVDVHLLGGSGGDR